MKILFLSAANNIHTVRWVNELSSRGHEIILVSNKNHKVNDYEYNENVKEHYLKFSGNFGYFLNINEMRRLYKQISPDVVNAHYASGYGLLARLSKLKPLVLSVWGSDVYDFPYQSKIKMNLIRKNISYADKVASTSISMSKQVQRIMNNNMNIAITPFGVDTDIFTPKVSNSENKRFTVGVVKTLSEKYGIEYIIKSFHKFMLAINKDDYTAKETPILKIYGRGEQEQYLRNLVHELKINEFVSFEGYIQNSKVPNVINEFDIFCAGSILDSESFGVAAVEAMACEIPVIATDVSGFKEVIVDGVTGYIVQRKNIDAMAEKMLELFYNKDLRRSFGLNGRIRVLENYSWKDNVSQMEAIYENIKLSR